MELRSVKWRNMRQSLAENRLRRFGTLLVVLAAWTVSGSLMAQESHGPGGLENSGSQDSGSGAETIRYITAGTAGVAGAVLADGSISQVRRWLTREAEKVELEGSTPVRVNWGEHGSAEVTAHRREALRTLSSDHPRSTILHTLELRPEGLSQLVTRAADILADAQVPFSDLSDKLIEINTKLGKIDEILEDFNPLVRDPNRVHEITERNYNLRKEKRSLREEQRKLEDILLARARRVSAKRDPSFTKTVRVPPGSLIDRSERLIEQAGLDGYDYRQSRVVEPLAERERNQLRRLESGLQRHSPKLVGGVAAGAALALYAYLSDAGDHSLLDILKVDEPTPDSSR